MLDEIEKKLEDKSNWKSPGAGNHNTLEFRFGLSESNYLKMRDRIILALQEKSTRDIWEDRFQNLFYPNREAVKKLYSMRDAPKLKKVLCLCRHRIGTHAVTLDDSKENMLLHCKKCKCALSVKFHSHLEELL